MKKETEENHDNKSNQKHHETKHSQTAHSHMKDGKTHAEGHETKQDPLKEALSKQKEYLDTLQRLQAEFDNYRKRTDKETQDFREYAAKEFAKKMLPVLDSFELALKSTSDHEKFKKGVELIYAQFFSSLEDQGLKKISSINQKFDPYKHEVLMVDSKSKCKDDTVIEEFQPGYMWKSQVLRHSRVKIAKSAESCGENSCKDDSKDASCTDSCDCEDGKCDCNEGTCECNEESCDCKEKDEISDAVEKAKSSGKK